MSVDLVKYIEHSFTHDHVVGEKLTWTGHIECTNYKRNNGSMVAEPIPFTARFVVEIYADERRSFARFDVLDGFDWKTLVNISQDSMKTDLTCVYIASLPPADLREIFSNDLNQIQRLVQQFHL